MESVSVGRNLSVPGSTSHQHLHGPPSTSTEPSSPAELWSMPISQCLILIPTEAEGAVDDNRPFD